MPTSRIPEPSHLIISDRRKGRPAAVLALLATLAVTCSAAAPAAPPRLLAARILDAQRLVERLRGASFVRPVASSLLPERELAAVLGKKLVEDLPVPFETYAASLAAVGLIDPAPGLLGRLTNLYSRQVVGFYDPREGRFTIVPERITDGAGEGAAGRAMIMEEALLVHELTHALQDQRLGLARRIDALRESTDGLLALQALLEGEATLVMADALLARIPEESRPRLDEGGIQQLLGSLGPGNVEGAEGVPEYFVRQLLFPYASGTERVYAVRKEGGWAAVDALYRRPPETTLEILHPARALSRRHLPPGRRPSRSQLPASAAPLYADTLGAFSLAVLLERAGAGEQAGPLAACWQDDRVLFYAGDGHGGQQIGFVWRVLLASPEAARDVARLLRPLYEARPAPARPDVTAVDDVVEVRRVVGREHRPPG